MVILHLFDRDVRDPCLRDTAIVEQRNRIVLRLEDKPIRTPQVDCELAVAIAVERMAVAGDAVHVGKRGRGLECRQSTPEELPMICSPTSASLAVARARILQLPTGPPDLDDCHSLTH